MNPTAKGKHPPFRLWHGAALGAVLGLCLSLAGSGARACRVDPHSQTEMPDSLSAPWPGSDRATTAWFDGPTTRYPHGVLGDTIEATILHVYTEGAASSCGNQSVTLPETLVFEDLVPRLADLDGDGEPEIIVVQSHQQQGAQLAIYRPALDGVGLDLVAATPFIGRRNRWLAPIGVADFNGDGQIDIAYIDRPHLARTLRVWSFVPGGLAGTGELREIAAAGGLTNHRIGEAFITGGVRDCGRGPEMVVADADWRQVVAVRLSADNQITAEALGGFSQAAVAAALNC